MQKNFIKNYKKTLSLTLLALIFTSNFLCLNVAKAEVGDTQVGKYYTADEIVLRTQIDIAGTDGIYKENYNFVRVGNESSKSNFKIKVHLFLEKPDTLTLNSTNWVGQAERDGVKGPTRVAGTWGQYIYGIVGVGRSFGMEADVKCEWKNVQNPLYFWQNSQDINDCYDRNLGQGATVGKTTTASDVHYDKKTVWTAGQEVYNDEIILSQADFAKLKMNKSGMTYHIQVWPQLLVNVGDTTLTDMIISGAAFSMASVPASKMAKGLSGKMGSLLSYANKVFKKEIPQEVAEKQAAAELVANGLTETEATAAAKAAIKSFLAEQTSAGSTVLSENALKRAAKLGLEELKNAGMAEDSAAVVVKGIMEQMGAQVSTKGGETLVAAAGEKVVAEAATEVGFSKVAVATMGKIISAQGLKTILKIVPVVNIAIWAWTAVDLANYAFSFRQGYITYHDSLLSTVYVSLYDTESQVLADKDNPPPSDVKIDTGQKTGGGTKPNSDKGNSLLGFINQIITFLVYWLQQLIYWLFTFFISPLLVAMLSVRTYTDTFVSIIYPGWEVIRNICNIFFIIALMAIGLGTLFRIDSYQYKHTLVNFIIAALLVNFSLVMAQAVLGFADTVQNQFLPNSQVVVNSLAKTLFVNTKFAFTNTTFADSGYFSETIKPAIMLAFTIGTFLIFVAVTAFLFIRVVMLWIFLMISPVAYAAGAMPNTKSYQSKWWSEFIKYAFFTPIMAFFLNITAVIAGQQENNPALKRILSDPSVLGTDNGIVAFALTVASNLILLAFLIAGTKFAEGFGVMGADVASKWVKGGMMAPFGAVKSGIGFAAEKYKEKTGRELRPSKWIEGWKESRKINQEKRDFRGMAIAANKNSSLANPTTFFQRYAGFKKIGRVLQGGDKKGRQMLKDAAELRKKAKNIDVNTGDEETNKKNIAEKKHLLHEAEHLEEHATHFLAPEDMDTQMKLRSAINHKKGEVHTINWHELVSLSEAAIHEENAAEFMGYLFKLAETYNENEIINKFKYHRAVKAGEYDNFEEIKKKYEATHSGEVCTKDTIVHQAGEYFEYGNHGIQDFARLVLSERLNLGDKVSKKLIGDVSDIAEAHNHKSMMRMVENVNGETRYKTEADQAHEYVAELEKDQWHNILRANRLAGCEERMEFNEKTGEHERKTYLTNKFLTLFLRNFGGTEFAIDRSYITASWYKALYQNKGVLEAARKYIGNKEILDPDATQKYEKDELDAEGKIIHKRGERKLIKEIDLYDRIIGKLMKKGEEVTNLEEQETTDQVSGIPAAIALSNKILNDAAQKNQQNTSATHGAH